MSPAVEFSEALAEALAEELESALAEELELALAETSAEELELALVTFAKFVSLKLIPYTKLLNSSGVTLIII